MISLVLPAYNPGPTLPMTLAAVRRFVRSQAEPWEVVFVLDGCTDGSADFLAAELASRPDSRIRHIGYTKNRGKGYAVRTGLLAARGRLRLFTDIDLAYPFDDILHLADTLDAGSAVAVANRDHPESVVQLPPRLLGYAARRRVQSRLFGSAVRALLPIPLTDTQAGLKGMTASVAEAVLPDLTCDGFGFDCEFLTACARYGLSVAEVPVCVRYQNTATCAGCNWTKLAMLRDLWRIRRRWRNRVVEPIDTPAVAHAA